MAFWLPPGSSIEPADDAYWCQMYWQTENIPGTKLIRADQSLQEIFMAKIVAKGAGRFMDWDEKGNAVRVPMKYNVGDTVLFGRFHGERVDVGDAEFLTLRQDDILNRIILPKGEDTKHYKLAQKGDTDDNALAEKRVHRGLP